MQRRRNPENHSTWLVPVFSGAVALFAPTPASAHLPHPYILSLAADPREDTGVWALGVIDGAGARDTAAVFYSADAGAHFAPTPRQPPIAAADYDNVPTLLTTPSGVVLLSTLGEAWIFTGEAWLPWEGPEGRYLGPAAAVGENIAIATSLGVAVSGTGGASWVTASPTLARALAFDTSGGSSLAMLSEDGDLIVVGGDVAVPPTPMPLDAVGWWQGQLFAGGVQGVARLDSGAWTACAELPRSDPSIEAGGQVVRLGGDATTLAAGTGQALYLSEDGCRSWREALPFAEAFQYDGGLGSPTEPALAYTAITLIDDNLIVSGWDGIAAGSRSGDNWLLPRLLAAFTRGATVSPTWPTERRLYATTYGGGSVTSEDGGASWSGSAVGLRGNGLFGRDVADGAKAGLYWAGDTSLSESHGNGASFRSADLPTQVQVDEVHSDEGGAWLLGIGAEGRVLLHKEPEGAWELRSPAEGIPPSTLVTGTIGDESMLLGVRSGSALRSTDGGVTWSAIADDENDANAVAFSHRSGIDRILVGSLSAIYASDDAGETFNRVEGDVPPVATMVEADDGTLFVADDSGLLWRSVDGGSAWDATDGQFVSVQVILPLPSFADDQTLIVVSLTGVYWSADAGENWHTLPTLDRLDDAPREMSCLTATGGECVVEENEAYGSGKALALEPGDTVTVAMRGATVRWVGTGAGTLRVSDGGDYVAEIAEGEFAALGHDGVHDLTFMAQGLLQLDALEAQAAGEPIPLPAEANDPAEEPERCGCSTSRPAGGAAAVAAALLAGGVASVQRRNRR